ncbi:putative nuclease HARBI1 [Sycon ciliatum]|uniref:putative nuclease HARBI1 n=1 Tax=Sycon ciliatum TaxID=27933 RepID=UPI0031F633D0
MDSYRNRLSYYSIVLQAVSDADMIFTNCFAGYPGSVHDARVLRNSTLALEVANHQNVLFPLQTYIIGDSAYPLHQWLMVPVKQHGPGPTQTQMTYNDVHASTRKVVERAFPLLRCRWRKLQFVDLDIPEDYPKLIIACCVLHNVCRIHDADDVDYFLGVDAVAVGAADPQDDGVQGDDEAVFFNPAAPAQLRRQQLIQYLST